MKINLRIIKRLLTRISRKITSWNWANLLTFIALCFSIYQNKINDDRYFDNKTESDKESKRVSSRDSVQAVRDRIQTQTLIDEYKNQVAESRRTAKRDSAQLSLYGSQITLLNKSLKAQNQALDIQNQAVEIQRLTDKSELKIKLQLRSVRRRHYGIHILPVFSVYNRGNSSADLVDIKYAVVALDQWQGANTIKCLYNSGVATSDAPINPKETRPVQGILSFGIPAYQDSARQSIFSQKTIEISDRYNKLPSTEENWRLRTAALRAAQLYYPVDKVYYIIYKVDYRDKYQKDPMSIYSASRLIVTYPHDEQDSTYSVIPYPIRFNEVQYLKDCSVKEGFDFKKLSESIKQQGEDKSGNIIMYN